MSGTRHSAPTVRVDTVARGPVADRDVEYARAAVQHAAGFANHPVLSARAVLTMSEDPALERPARAEASLDVNGTQIRAHALASGMPGAVDLLEDKLRENLLQFQDRRRTRHRWIGGANDETWRHGDVPTARGASFPRPPQEREIVRRKTFALAPMSPDDAAYEMSILGHDFYLFTDRESGKEAVVYRDDDGHFAISGDAVGGPEAEATAGSVRVVASAPVLSESEAVARLDLSGEPFVFYLDSESRRGSVLYLRYDGHYGLITAA